MKKKKTVSSRVLSGCFIATIFIIVISALALTEKTLAEQGNDSAGPGRVEQKRLTGDNEQFNLGPHRYLRCDECHRMSSGTEPLPEEFSEPNSIQLCSKCHPDVNTHPVGIEPVSISSKTLPLLFPLGKKDMKGKIVCLTCHSIHIFEEGQFLLRGTHTTYRSKRTTLCLHCHPDRFQGKSPHVKHENACLYCHIARPAGKDQQLDTPDSQMQASCDLCHGELADSHYWGSNPFLDVIVREEAEKKGILAGNGNPDCTSCHEYHVETDGKALLSVPYMTLCSVSRSINPHWSDTHCLSCHERDPVKGDAPLRHNGSVNDLCNHCHRSEYARSDIHPVEIKPSQNVKIPVDMPLQDEFLTCTTCHDPFMQAGCVKERDKKEKNRFFLRGKEKSRISFCFLCHLEETYKRLNPHEQVDKEGEIKEETCLFCHASIPDVHYLGPEKVTFIVKNPDTYCIGCHHGFTKKHPAGVDHLRTPSNRIMPAMKTSIQRINVELPLYKGKIVCATCHNPHQTGVIQFSVAATGTKRGNKLRLRPGRMQCVGCHWDK